MQGLLHLAMSLSSNMVLCPFLLIFHKAIILPWKLLGICLLLLNHHLLQHLLFLPLLCPKVMNVTVPIFPLPVIVQQAMM
jgi:hypothetical protein